MPQFDSPEANANNPQAANQPGPEQQPGTALAPQRQEENDETMLARWEEAAAGFAGSLDVSKPAGQEQLYKAMRKGDSTLSMRVNEWLPVTDWLAHVVELTNEQTGEIRKAMRLVLFLKDGSTVSTTSPVFNKGFSYAMKLNGRGPWSPPLEVRAKLDKGNGVNKYLAFEGARIAGEETSSKPAAGGKPK